MSLTDKYKQRLEELGAAPKKSLGQNFLINEKVIADIIDSAKRAEASNYIEIGPGLGALTDHLKEFAPNYSLVELDDAFADYWEKQGLTVHRGDALKLNWNELVGESNNCLVSNLPYQISSSLVVELSLQQINLSSMILMFQKEVAQRIAAKADSKAYGVLSVIAQLCWETQTVCDAGPGSFYPPPKVSSRVLKFEKKEWAYDFEPRKFFSFVKSAFAQRRKKMVKSLKGRPFGLDYDDEVLKAALTAAGHDSDVRAEKLSPGQFVQVYKEISRT